VLYKRDQVVWFPLALVVGSTPGPALGAWVFSLHTNIRHIKPTQKIKAHMFALAFQVCQNLYLPILQCSDSLHVAQFTDHWGECAQSRSVEVVVNAEPEEQLLAWLDLHLYIVWKYLVRPALLALFSFFFILQS